MPILLIIILFFIFESICFSEDDLSDIVPATSIVEKIPEDLKDLEWNKWDTENFIILSIDKKQGLFIKNNIEKIKSNIYKKWGYKDIEFSGECKLVCVSTDKLLKRIFKLDGPKVEFRKNNDNKLELSVIWFSLENEKMPLPQIAEVCFVQKEHKNSFKMPLFYKRGMIFLENDIKFIKENLSKTNISENIQDVLDKDVSENSIDFDCNSAILCLLMKNEYGLYNFYKYTFDRNLRQFGFENNKDEKIKVIFNRYSRNLLQDLKNNKVPDYYLNKR
jgi:hypothetical protein